MTETTQIKKDRDFKGSRGPGIAHIEEDDNKSRNMLGVECAEQSCCERDRESYSCAQPFPPLSTFEHLRTQRTVCLQLQLSESSDVLPHLIEKLTTGGDTSFSVMTQHCNSEERKISSEMSIESIDCKGKEALASKIQDNYNVASPNEICSTDSHEIYPTSEQSDELLDQDFSYELQNNEQVKKYRKIRARDKKFKCDVCGAKFPSYSHLNIHNKIHTGEKPYKCDDCGAAFTRCSHLDLHKKVHTGERPYKCDVCGGGFIDKSNLNVHRRIHTGEKPYKCEFCGVGFARSGSLKLHEKTHTGEKPFKCDICGVSFIRVDNLRRHIRIHTGERPYKCDFCGVTFSESSKLKIHKRIHTAEKPYECDVCGAGFADKSNLNVHKRVHKGDKHYKCEFCDVGFTRSGRLKSHIKTHTGECS